MSQNRNGPLSLAQAVSSAKAFQAEAGPSRAAGTNPNSFKAPAHKHAHHLHSIPPREKSTRTLIIDHMLWAHGRTRFAQARAELGMTDRTGGPTSSNYSHRRRPENYEEDDEAGSDGEAVSSLKARREPDDDEEARLHAQDLQLSRSLRLRAEGLEKVINSMLVQPPPVHLHFEDDFFVDPNQHILPNGVRLRLALGTLVNDFFARQAPPPPFRHKKFAAANISASSPMTTNTSDSSSISAGLLPPALNLLVPISAYGGRKAEKRARKQLKKEQASASASARSSHSLSHTISPNPYPSQNSQYSSPSSSLKLPSRTRSLYLAGTDPETANSPPAFRCPRHLHTGCEICVEAKEEFSVKGAGGKGKARERAGSTSTFSAPSWPSTSSSTSLGIPSNQKVTPIGIAPDGGGISGYQDPSTAGGCSVGVGEGLLKPSINGSALRRRTASPYTRRSSRGGGGESEADSTGSGYTKLSELLPRFLRLSALVSTELGREVREGREGKDLDELKTSTSSGSSSASTTTKQGVGGSLTTLAPSREWYHLLAGILTRAALQGYLTAGWRGVNAVECLMGVGLGIDLNGFRSAPPAERGISNVESTSDSVREASPSSSTDDPDADSRLEAEADIFAEDEDFFKGFNPDELPTLQQAVAILFPSLGLSGNIEGEDRLSERDTRNESGSDYSQTTPRKRQPNAAEVEFANEMNERLRGFLEIPDSTPDLSTHMEDLAWTYPAEPVERAAVRFCEAIAGWRGKPELEGYKKKPPRTWPSTHSNSRTGTSKLASTPLTMESLVHSNPATPTLSHPQPAGQTPVQSSTSSTKPSIDVYFIHPASPSAHTSETSSEDHTASIASREQLNTTVYNNVPTMTSLPRLETRQNPRGQSFSAPTTTPIYSTPSQAHHQPRPNSFPQSYVGPTTQFPGRPSLSPRTTPNSGSSHNHVLPSSSAQYAYYPNNMSSSQSINTSPASGMAQQHSMQSPSSVEQRIPVWNAATGAWMPTTTSQGIIQGTTAEGVSSKRTRSPERGQGLAPNAKRTR
ncbi:hypothetical protein DFJ43DRAFT_1039316 [Lentinula guzmanii]|uniref:Uncharacterized protein n=1 Tax=Lentinula guzmanii TaxID=2804957 RepID=A0AA38MU07_9AGAR|nr:hypothetical protein DFJ43DRAFT_1039316 [Lentinula guzmanii]KAJ3792992.1 hypothetical protein GGU11DRAFT_854395 [Lentinula aff. detonsa]